MPDVVVVGGGAIGCATAFFLARAGANATLLERGELAGEASGAAAGMLAALSDAGGDRGPAFQALCLDGLKAFDELLPELGSTGIDLRYRRTGVLHLALNEAEASRLRNRYEAQTAVAPELRWLDESAIATEEPEASPRAVAGLVSPNESYLDPQRLVLALAEAARRHGARIETMKPLAAIRAKGGEARSVRVGGQDYPFDALVLACGAWTAEIARRLHSYVPVRPYRGQMVALQGPGTPLRRVIWGEKAYLVPRENNLTFVGATVEDVGFRARTTKRGTRRIQSAAAKLVPGLALGRRVSAWAGLRPASPDRLPIMGRLPGWRNVWVATGHFRNGILLAPITGKLIAASVLAGRPDPSLAPFDPSRFVE